MAIGNNSNKKKKIIVRTKPDPYLRKEWFGVTVPSMFKCSHVGQTPVYKTVGLRVSSEVVKGRIVHTNLGDLAENERQNGYSKFSFKVVDCKDSVCKTDFTGFDTVRHYEQSLFRKGCSVIKCEQDIYTKDGYLVRIFAQGFTARKQGYKKSNCYAKTSEIKQLRRAMSNIILSATKDFDCNKLMAALAGQTINGKMAEAAQSVFPVRDCMIIRAKVVTAPKYTEERINTLYSGNQMEFGKPVESK